MLSDLSNKRATFGRLRRQLDPRHRSGTPAGAGPIAIGVGGVDEALGGGLSPGGLTELVFSSPSSGGQLVLLHLLQTARRLHRFLGLVDGADGFDPQSIEPPALLRHLLWVRCGTAATALQAADLIARDTNFALLALDLRGCPARELRRTPSTLWYRLQRVLEPTSTALVILTPQRLVPAARARLVFDRPLPLTCLTMEQAVLGDQLTPAAERVRMAAGWETTTAPARSRPAIAYPQGPDDEAMGEGARIVAEDADDYAAIEAVG